ncbi:MAG: hypothetical protein IT436_08940 [Phycisphaerales bacterium]|nr:hypothetical protein [Phycisphaerales bacterium]
MPRRAILIAIGAAASLTIAAAHAGPGFELLPSVGPNPGSYVVARGISGDGLVIAGSQVPLMWERPFIWRKVDGEWVRTELPREGGFGWGRPVALSYTGDTIAGMTNQYLSGAIGSGTPAVWRGVLSGTPTVLSPLDDAGQPIRRGCWGGVSSDGSVAGGFAQLLMPTLSPGELWRLADSATTQISPAGPSSYASALIAGNAISGDGLIMVGSATAGEFRLALRWTAADGFVSLATPTSGNFRHSRAECISRDGAVIGGHLAQEALVYNTGARPCVWRDGVRTDLPLLAPALTSARVLAISGDGAVAGGAAYTQILGLDTLAINNNVAALWIHGRAYRLSTYLAERGTDLQGVEPCWISGISDDGKTLAGCGEVAGSSALVSFVVTLPTLCEGDLTEDGLTDFADYLLFLNYYETADARVDFTGDSRIDFGDYLEFLNLYELGC